MAELTKRQTALIRSLYKRHGRKKHRLCVCEGLRCCRELALLCPELIELAVCREDFDASEISAEFMRVSPAEFDSLSSTVHSQGVLIVAKIPEPENIQPKGPFLVVLDRLNDPGNFGTILRTVRALGLPELWYTSGTVDPFNDKVIRSALASQFAVRLREFSGLDAAASACRDAGYSRIYRTDPHTGKNCFAEPELFEKSVIILGSEAGGAGELAGSVPLTIPMPGDAESLNVAQAATVILFDYVRRTTSI